MRIGYIFILFLFIYLSGGNINSVQSKEIKNLIYLESNDTLFFSKQDYTQYKNLGIKFTDEFIINEDEFLSIHFTLDKPLIQSLQDLAPSLSDTQLLEVGNFQFSFLVDEKLIYLENLNKGAGLPESKTKQLHHIIPLVTPKQIDFWGWFLWLKFMKKGGGQEVLDKGTHTLKIEIRPYINEENPIVGKIIANGTLNVTTSEKKYKKIKKRLVSIQKIQPKSGWKISSAKYDKNKIEELNIKITQKRFEDINGIVVIKEGELLIEEYFNGETRESLHDSRSVGKSFASTIIGIAIKEQHISSENELLKNFYNLNSFQNYSSKKDSVTLKSLLTMSSGFLGDDGDYSSPGNEENMYPTKDWVKFALDLPMEEKKLIGNDFDYFTAGAVILGDIIHKSVPGGLVSFTDEKLFKPLGITKYKWEFTPQNVGNTAGGLRLRAIDFAKYGQLYKNEGTWNGKQILTKQWVQESLSKQVKLPLDDVYYGYLFWNKVYIVNGVEYEVSYSSGRGGNKIFIFKDIPIVIVITASAYNSPSAHVNVDKMMIDYLIPAIVGEKF